MYFGSAVKEAGGVGKFFHHRVPADIDNQTVIRMNRDTLYSSAIFDLHAGPVTITLPDSGKRFRSMQIVNEDEYTPYVAYDAGSYTLDRDTIGTRYVLAIIRTLVDPNDPKDIEQVHALQDATTIEQTNSGKFEVPNWDLEGQKKIREALLVIGASLPDSKKMFGSRDQVEPVRFLIGCAAGWGGNPEKEATYLNVVPTKNDGITAHTLTVKDVPVDGFWSISIYNANGFFEKNDQNAYSINNITGKKDANGSVTIHFGGSNSKATNYLPIMPGWNYAVRLYRPRKAILEGTYKFPEAQPVA